MVSNLTNHEVSNPEVVEDRETSCAACGHPRTAHDIIAARFCTATTVGQFSRGCVCTNVPLAPTPAE